MADMINQHPIKIISYSSRNLWLLTFPLLRGLLSVRMDVFELYRWLRGAWFDILILAVIIFIGWLRWRFTKIYIGENKFIIKSGIAIKREAELEYTEISCVSFSRGLILRFIRACNVSTYTSAAQMNRKPEISLLLRKQDAALLEERLPFGYREPSLCVYKPSFAKAALFALVLSGRINSRRIPLKSVKLFFSRRTVVIALATLLVVFRSSIFILMLAALTVKLLFFVSALLKYGRLKIHSNAGSVIISSGILSYNTYYINSSLISLTAKKSGLFTGAFIKEYVIYCATAIYIPVLEYETHVRHRSGIKPKSLMAYIILPLSFFFVFAIAGAYLFIFLKITHDFIVLFIITLCMLMLFFAAIRMRSFYRSEIIAGEEELILKFHRHNGFYTMRVHKSNLVKVSESQNIFQRITDTCSLCFYFRKRRSLKISFAGMEVNEVTERINHFGDFMN